MQSLPHDAASLFKHCQSDVLALDIRALDQFISSHAAARVDIEQAADNFARVNRQRVVVRSVLSTLDLLVEVLF